VVPLDGLSRTHNLAAADASFANAVTVRGGREVLRVPAPVRKMPKHCLVPRSVEAGFVRYRPMLRRNWATIWHTTGRDDRRGPYGINPTWESPSHGWLRLAPLATRWRTQEREIRRREGQRMIIHDTPSTSPTRNLNDRRGTGRLESAPLDKTQAGLVLPPADTKRWSCRRKAAVVVAVRHGMLAREEACEHYGLSDEELALWEAAFDKSGIPGLRVSSLRYYRSAAPPQGAAMLRQR
jgi:hypothetical protein